MYFPLRIGFHYLICLNLAVIIVLVYVVESCLSYLQDTKVFWHVSVCILWTPNEALHGTPLNMEYLLVTTVQWQLTMNNFISWGAAVMTLKEWKSSIQPLVHGKGWHQWILGVLDIVLFSYRSIFMPLEVTIMKVARRVWSVTIQ